MKFVRILLCLMLITSVFAGAATPAVDASSGNDISFERVISEQVIQLDDGKEVVVTIYSTPVSTYAMSYSRVGTKKFSMRDEAGSIMYEFSLQGVFQVNKGVSVVCISASHDYETYHSGWRYVSGSSHTNANKAFGHATFEGMVDSVTLLTREIDLVLTCDENGNLS